jgi:hypothetical protein
MDNTNTETVPTEKNGVENNDTENPASTTEEKNFKEGDFSFVENKLHRYMLADIYTAIEKTKLWDFVNDESIKAETFLENPEVLKLFLSLKYKSHSIETFGVAMRNMKKIGKVGWDEYVKEWLATKV